MKELNTFERGLRVGVGGAESAVGLSLIAYSFGIAFAGLDFGLPVEGSEHLLNNEIPAPWFNDTWSIVSLSFGGALVTFHGGRLIMEGADGLKY